MTILQKLIEIEKSGWEPYIDSTIQRVYGIGKLKGCFTNEYPEKLSVSTITIIVN